MSGAPKQSAEAVLSELADAGHVIGAMIEISDRCNEVCVHCYQIQGQKGEMDTAQVKAVMDDLAQAGVLRLTISGGEATLRRDFVELLEYARSLGFLVTLFTNGLTMTDSLARDIARLGVFAVEISLYGISAPVHDFVTGVPGSFDLTVAGIRRLTALGVDVLAKTPAMSMLQESAKEYDDFVRGLGAHPAVGQGNLHAREDGDRGPESLRRDDGARLRRLRESAWANPRAPRGVPPRELDRAPCGAGRYVHVEPNGRLEGCTMLRVGLGDATQGDVRGFQTRPMVRQLTGLTWRDIHGCRECDLAGYCNHCYASALDEVGDALAPYPTACQGGRMQYQAYQRVTLAFAGEPSELGPYRIESDGRLRAFPDRVSPEDDALARRLGWVRVAGFVAQSQPPSARPGELVQLRRPGRKAAAPHRLPGGVEGSEGEGS